MQKRKPSTPARDGQGDSFAYSFPTPFHSCLNRGNFTATVGDGRRRLVFRAAPIQMRATYEIKLPRSRAPRFPDRCAVCDKEHPDSKLTLSAHAFAWWMVFVWWAALLSWFKGFQCAIPACSGCARKFMRQYRLRFVIEAVLVLAAIALAIYLVRDIPRPWQKWAGIGSALLILMPMFVWQALWPMRVQIDTDGSTVEYQFTDAEYANEFKAMNKPKPAKMEGPFAATPADETDENARIEAMFEQGRLDAVVSVVENRLRGIEPVTPFHAIIGKDFLHQVEQVADWLAAFYDAVSDGFRPAAIYVEMNRFDINFDQWHIEAMAHIEVPNGPMHQAEWDGDISSEFVLTNMEKVQKAMEEFQELSGQAESFEAIDQNLRDAQGDAFFLVMLHMQNLVKRAALLCRQRGHSVGSIPVAANVHDKTMEFTVQPDGEAATLAAGRSVPPAKYINRPGWQVKYPHNWRIDVEQSFHDIDNRILVVGPGAWVQLERYDESALKSLDENTREMAEIIWNREKTMPPTDVKARARKLVEELPIANPVAKRFDHWGKYHGEGIRVTGRLRPGPGSAAVFTGKAGPLSFVAVEICVDDKVARCSAGLELMKSTFMLSAACSQLEGEA